MRYDERRNWELLAGRSLDGTVEFIKETTNLP